MCYEYRDEFLDNGRVKITFLGYDNDPAHIELQIMSKGRAEPEKRISITENESGSIIRAIKAYYRYITGGAENG